MQIPFYFFFGVAAGEEMVGEVGFGNELLVLRGKGVLQQVMLQPVFVYVIQANWQVLFCGVSLLSQPKK